MSLVLVDQERNIRSVMGSMRNLVFNLRKLRMLAVVASILFVGSGSEVIAQKDSDELIKAEKLIQKNRALDAIELLKDYLGHHKTEPAAWNLLGIAYLYSSDHFYSSEIKEALSCFKKTIVLDPKSAAGHVGLAEVYLRTAKRTDALHEAQTAIDLEPENPFAQYIFAFVNFQIAELDEAIKHLDSAITKMPNYASAHLLKAQALINTTGLIHGITKEARDKQHFDRYLSAADSLRRYVELSGDKDGARIWKNQIGEINTYVDNDQPLALTGKMVTTKARLTSKPEPTYTEYARKLQITGTVILRAVFAADGTVTHIQVLYALAGVLTEQAIRAAEKIRFIPATVDGKPASMLMQLEYNFNLY